MKWDKSWSWNGIKERLDYGVVKRVTVTIFSRRTGRFTICMGIEAFKIDKWLRYRGLLCPLSRRTGRFSSSPRERM